MSTSNTFGTTKRLHGDITSSSDINSTGRGGIFNSGKSRQSLAGSSLYEYSDAVKSNSNGNEFIKSSLNSGQTGRGGILRDSGITGLHTEPIIPNIGSVTTKSPFSYVTTPRLTPPSPFSGPRSNNLGQSSFNFGSSDATANAAANARKSTIAYGTSLDTQSTSGIAGTAPGYGESLVNSGIKGSFGNIRPGYGAVPLKANLNIGIDAWSKQSENEGKTTSAGGITSGAWSGASGVRSAERSEIESKTLTDAQLDEGISPLGKPFISGNNPWLNKLVSGSKSTLGTTSDTSSAASGIGSAGHSENEGKVLIGAQLAGGNSLLGKQLASGSNPWLNKQPASGSTFGIASDTSSATSGIKAAGHAENESKTFIGAQLAGNNSLLGKQLVSASNPWLNKQSTTTSRIPSGSWFGTSTARPKEQSGSGSKTWSGAPSGGSRSGKESESESETEEDDYSWDVQNSCSRGLKGPIKTYYPTGTGYSNVPSSGNTTPRDLAKWNPANPFLFGAKGKLLSAHS